jgi:hypothetical protein
MPAGLVRKREAFDHPDFLFELKYEAGELWPMLKAVAANWFPEKEMLSSRSCGLDSMPGCAMSSSYSFI